MSDAKKRKKKFYCKNPKIRKIHDYHLHAGIQGFLITTSGKERESVREAYFLLNQFADIKYGPEKLDDKDSKADDVNDDEDEDDIDFEEALKNEKKQIEATKNVARRFQAVETGAKSTVFIRCRDINPSDLMSDILADLEKNKVQKFRYIQRMLPLTDTCKAKSEDVKKTLDKVFKEFKSSSKFKETMSYSVLFKSRNSNALSRHDIYSAVEDVIVREQLWTWTVELDDPDIHVLVEVIKGVCCLGIVTDFLRFKKYNLHNVVAGESKKSTASKNNDVEVENNELENKSEEQGQGKGESNIDATEVNVDAEVSKSNDAVTKENVSVEKSEQSNSVENE